jgi:Ca2+-binding RTX toxin-like protein
MARSRRTRTSRTIGRSKAAIATIVLALGATVGVAAPPLEAQVAGGLQPWEAPPGARANDAVGAGFQLSLNDLDFIRQQILISETHTANLAASADPASEMCSLLIGDGANQIPPGPNAEEQPFGVRTVSGVCNNLVNDTTKNFGAAEQPFIRLTTADYRDADLLSEVGAMFGPPPPVQGQQTSYAQVSGTVEDSQPRIISNLIVDQTADNPAATAAAGGPGLPACAPLAVPPVEPPCEPPAGETYYIPNVAPDEGLSAPFNDMLTFFGQFFDHGLDLTTKTGDLVFMPLQTDDPLCQAPASCGFGPGQTPPFMLLSRATNPDFDPVNKTTPFVDQNQTYTSHPSHQVFLREYANNAAGDPVSTGRLIEGVAPNGIDPSGGMATWADVKAQAASLLGLELIDTDGLNVPMLATDLYGNFLPGLNGYPQIVVDRAGIPDLIEGNPLAPVPMDGTDATGVYAVVRTGHAFILDIAHHAAPGSVSPQECSPADAANIPADGLKVADADTATTDDGSCLTYDNELFDLHFIAGDGRVNENIALTSVHHVFHSEHNRLTGHVEDVISALPATDPLRLFFEPAPGVYNGERLFQAAKFGTEMEYQHLAFEEFARTVQPNVNPFAGYDSSINSGIFAEFAHSVYRFGHSMLNETVARYNADGTPNDLGLIEAFLNPEAWLNGGQYTPEQAAGAIFRGGTTQVGQEIDEFVIDALRNSLLGLPLDLATINLARGRDAGIPRLNDFRRQIFAQTSDSSMAPYSSWTEFGLELKRPESLVNFIAAYGAHDFITTFDDGSGPNTLSSRRAAAQLMAADDPSAPIDTFEFMTSTGPGVWETTPGLATNTGVDDVDLWVGGLAEKREIFGGLLGPSLNYVFELQMENLQDGDRFYYLHRLAGEDLLATLEGNSFSELIERNTDASNLPAVVFTRPDYFFDASFHGPSGPILDNPATEYDETTLLIRMPDGTLRFNGAEHALWGGTDGVAPAANDKIQSGEGDDTVRGAGGNDRLEGDGGNDTLIGGEGDDILTDSFGDDVLKGGPGNDALQGGPGLDLLLAGEGDDFVVQGSDLSETFGGGGDDIIFGGAAATIIFGGDGDDWVEGGGQADLIQGGNGNPFQTDITGGHDVLIGNGGGDDYDSEGGDDILVAGPGISRFEGMIGFDWTIHYNDTQPVDSDLERTVLLPVTVDPLRDRFDLVEGLSGWDGDDILRGDTAAGAAIPGENDLDADGIARIAGLADILPPGTISIIGGDTGNNIILGGGGSDLIQGRGGDDILDGDRWMRVQLEATDINGVVLPRVDASSGLRPGVFAGTINPGAIDIIRTIETAPAGTDVDVAVYAGKRADYNVTELSAGVWRVDHVRGCGDPIGGDPCPDAIAPDGSIVAGIDDGTDRLLNIETVRFLNDEVVDISVPALTGFLRVTTSDNLGTVGLPSQILVDGFIADTWGVNDVEIAIGQHEVCFTDVQLFTTPTCRTVVVNVDQTTTTDGQFTANGWLRVQTNPPLPSTITVEGEPANDWGMWSDIAPGIYEVCWGAVEFWAPPLCQDATVTAGATTPIIGDFTADPLAPAPTNFGTLRVTTSHDGDPLAGINGKVTVDDGVGTLDLNDHWGLTWLKLEPSTPNVCFSDVPGFTTPPCQEVTVSNGVTTVVDGMYTRRGSLRVLTAPDGGQPSTISVDGIARNATGMWTDFPTGTHQVCFGDVLGKTTPGCQTAEVNAAALTEVTGTFL